jgi:uncharacterized protein YaeQ
MPCRDYEGPDDWEVSRSDETRKLREQNDRLARIACKAMTELVKSGYADFLILQDDEVRIWWEQHQEADRKAKEAEEKKLRIAKLKKEALAKLSMEEKKALGLKV